MCLHIFLVQHYNSLDTFNDPFLCFISGGQYQNSIYWQMIAIYGISRYKNKVTVDTDILKVVVVQPNEDKCP